MEKHEHNITNTSIFEIDAITKKIKKPKDMPILVQGSHNSESITFKVPKNINGHDMSQSKISIHYQNINTDTGEESIGIEEVKNLEVTDDGSILFSWKITRNATKYWGGLCFSVHFKCIENGELAYQWNTIDFAAIPIYPSKNNMVGAIKRQPDIMTQLFAKTEAMAIELEKLQKDAHELERFDEFKIVNTQSGASMTISNTLEQPFQGMKIFGESKQVTTTGKNLLPCTATTKTTNGLTFTVNKDKSVTVTGTATADTRFDVYKSETGFSAGSYVLSGGVSQDAYIAVLSFNGSSLGISSNVGSDITFSVTEEQTLKGVSIRLMVTSGATVNGTFFPMIRSASDTDNTFEAYSGGVPSPSPEWPQEVVSYGDNGSEDVYITGNNLYYNGTEMICTYNIYVTDDGEPTSQMLCGMPFYCFPGTTVSAGNGYKPGQYLITPFPCFNGWEHINVSLAHMAMNEEGIPAGYIAHYDLVKDSMAVEPFEITLNENEMLFVYLNVGVDLARDIIPDTNIVIEEIEKAKPVQKLSISPPNGLASIPLSASTNYATYSLYGKAYYCDVADLGRGVKIENIKKRVFDGSEDWMFISVDSGCFTFGLVDEDVPDVLIHEKSDAIMSTHFETDPFIVEGGLEGCAVGEIYYGEKGGIAIGISGKHLADATNEEKAVESFKELLSSLCPTFMYARTPIERPLSNEEMAAYKALYTRKPTTNIYPNDIYKEVDYVIDTKAYIDNKIAKEIAAGDEGITLRDIHTRLVALESENAELKSALDDMVNNE